MLNTKDNKQILEKEICEKEKYYIAFYKTTNSKNGYNITEGGDGISGYKFSDAAKKAMSEARLGEKHWNYGKLNSAGKKILQYDKNGHFIKEYPSIQQAHRETQISACNISQCINGKYNSAGGYIWKKKGDDKPTNKECSLAKQKSNDKTVLQYALNGQFIQEYISAAEAARHINYDPSTVSGAACGKFKTCGPYIFIYKKLFTNDLLQEKIKLATMHKYRKRI